MSTKTKKLAALAIMKRRWLTPLAALYECGLLSLSQRAGELRREGYTVISKRVQGECYHQYRVIE